MLSFAIQPKVDMEKQHYYKYIQEVGKIIFKEPCRCHEPVFLRKINELLNSIHLIYERI